MLPGVRHILGHQRPPGRLPSWQRRNAVGRYRHHRLSYGSLSGLWFGRDAWSPLAVAISLDRRYQPESQIVTVLQRHSPSCLRPSGSLTANDSYDETLLANLIIFDRTKSHRRRIVELNSEVRDCHTAKANDLMIMFGFFQTPASHSMISRRRFSVLAKDAGIEGLVWHDLRATYGTRFIRHRQANGTCAYFNESALRSQFASWRRRGSHAKKSAPSQQHRSHALSGDSGTLRVAVNS